ncbi:MAG TPA: hypothetical protein PLC04_07930 [Candidatus Kapabacteria bacterium]|nr:hypothetical protein [Candidatus Kapabacteria bacterium]
MKITNIKELKGKTITGISCLKTGSDVVELRCDDNSVYVLQNLHYNDEYLYIDDIGGETADIINSPLTNVQCHVENQEITNGFNKSKITWTVFTLETEKGQVVIEFKGMPYCKKSAIVHLIQIN